MVENVATLSVKNGVLGGEHTLESSGKMFLEGRSSTIELRPQGPYKYYHTPKNAQFQVGGFRQCSLILV